MNKTTFIIQCSISHPETDLKVFEAKYMELIEKGYIKKTRTNVVQKSTGMTPKQIAIAYFSEWIDWVVHKRLIETTEATKEILQSFDAYWTELNKNWTKQRWEQQKTFEVQKRLATWLSRWNFKTNIKKWKTIW